MALVVKRTAAAGGSDPQVTTQSAIYTLLAGAFVSAGWTQLDVLSATDVVYFSPGETTFDTQYFRLRGTITDAIQFMGYQYWDPVGHQGYNEFGNIDTGGHFYSGTGVNGYLDWNRLPSGAYDYVVSVDRDSFVMFFKHNSSGNYWFQNGGNLLRVPGARRANMALQTGVSAGINVTCDIGVDPSSLGYKRGDLVKFVSQQTTGPAANIIPVFTARILDYNAGAHTIVVDVIQENVSAGCLVGADPMPFYLMYTNSANTDPRGQDVLRTLTASRPGCVNEYQQIQTEYGTTSHWGWQSTSTLIGTAAGNNPNKRTNRYGIWRLAAIDNHYFTSTASNALWRGYQDKLFLFSQQVTLYDIARTQKESPTHDYVCINWSGNWYCIGPVA